MALERRAPAKTLADRVAIEIKKELYGRGHNQAELARTLGKSQTWVSARLNGNIELTVNDLELIADVLGVESDELMRRARQSQPTLTLPASPALPQIPQQRPPDGRPPGRPSSDHRPPPGARRATPAHRRP